MMADENHLESTKLPLVTVTHPISQTKPLVIHPNKYCCRKWGDNKYDLKLNNLSSTKDNRERISSTL